MFSNVTHLLKTIMQDLFKSRFMFSVTCIIGIPIFLDDKSKDDCLMKGKAVFYFQNFSKLMGDEPRCWADYQTRNKTRPTN